MPKSHAHVDMGPFFITASLALAIAVILTGVFAVGLLGVILRQRFHGVGGLHAADSQFNQVVESPTAGALGLFLIAGFAGHMLGVNGLQGGGFK